MQSHQEQFQEAKKLTDFDNRHKYPESGTIRSFASAIEVFTTQKKLKGIVVFVIMKNDPNLLDQKRLEMEIMKKNIKVKRATLEELHFNLKKDEKNDIYYENELVSIVYYRVGYRFEHFKINGDPELGWKVKEEIELSNAYCIPPVSMELINEKRMQVELAKPEVLRKFVSEEDAVKLEKVFVKFWDFDSLSEEDYQNIINEIKIKPEAYILKPNLEGGSNNYFGLEALHKLEGLTRQQAKVYILMEKIESKSIVNAIMDGKDYKDVNCIY